MQIKKIITASILFSFFILSNQSTAQLSFTADGGMIIPIFTGSPQDPDNLFGFDAMLKINTNKKIRLGLDFGYYSITTVDGVNPDIRASLIPISASFEYSFKTEGFSPYVGMAAGVYLVTVSSVITSVDPDVHFGLSPIFGVDYYVTEHFGLNANAKFHYVIEGHNETLIGFGLGLFYKI